MWWIWVIAALFFLRLFEWFKSNSCNRFLLSIKRNELRSSSLGSIRLISFTRVKLWFNDYILLCLVKILIVSLFTRWIRCSWGWLGSWMMMPFTLCMRVLASFAFVSGLFPLFRVLMLVDLFIKIDKFCHCFWLHLWEKRYALFEWNFIFLSWGYVIFYHQCQHKSFSWVFLALVNFDHSIQLVLKIVILEFHILVTRLVVVHREVKEIHLLLQLHAWQRVVVLPKLHWDLVGCQVFFKECLFLVVRP